MLDRFLLGYAPRALGPESSYALRYDVNDILWRTTMKHLSILALMCLLVVPAAFADWTTTTPGQVTTTDVVGVGTHTPGQGAGLSGTQEAPIHVFSTQNKNTFILAQNMTNDLNVAPAIRTLADFASQNFQSHASSRTISRFGTTLGGWNEFLSVTGNGLIL